MVRRPLGRTGLTVTPIGFGAFKIGRNEGIKYSRPYPLPSDTEAAELLAAILELGINYIDTAPAYGVSEERIGRAIAGRRDGIVVSTKAGETFESGRSRYDFSPSPLRQSIERSRLRLGVDALDLVFLHAPSDDLMVLDRTDAVTTLQALKEEGVVRAIGFSGTSVAAAERALEWSDALMVTYHLEDRSHAGVIAAAHQQGVGVVVKKGLASGRLDPAAAIRFVLDTPGVSSLVVGTLSRDHMREILAQAATVTP